MLSLPENLNAYKKTKVFTEKTVPKGLLKNHNTIAGVWAKIIVLNGCLRYVIQSTPREIVDLSKKKYGVVEPTMHHHIEPVGEVEFYVEFYKK